MNKNGQEWIKMDKNSRKWKPNILTIYCDTLIITSVLKVYTNCNLQIYKYSLNCVGKNNTCSG